MSRRQNQRVAFVGALAASLAASLVFTARASAYSECGGAWQSYETPGGVTLEVRFCNEKNTFEKTGWLSKADVRNPNAVAVDYTVDATLDNGEHKHWSHWTLEAGESYSWSVDSEHPTWRFGATLKKK